MVKPEPVSVVLILLHVEEEECLVLAVVEFRNAYRAADGEAEIVVAGARPEQRSVLSVRRVGSPGVQSFIGEEFVAAAVIVVGARNVR